MKRIKLVAESQDYRRGGTQKDKYSSDECIEVPCPLCTSGHCRRIYTEHGVIGISECVNCGLIYTSPRFKSPEKIYWGEAENYYEEARLIFEGKAPHHRDPNYHHEIKVIERVKRGGSFLDVGCNMGMLLRHAEKRGWEVTGVEPSPSLSSLAGKHGFRVYNCFLHELPEELEESFDVVALSDVFEHITEPRPFLGEAARFLKPDGILYVKVPNVRWTLFKQMMLGLANVKPEQGLWDSYEHVVHYTDRTLREMLAKSGFRTLHLSIEPPVQTPNWHEYVGQYFQYPTPWVMDWRRKLVREVSYRLSKVERMLRFGSVGYLAPNIVAIAAREEAFLNSKEI